MAEPSKNSSAEIRGVRFRLSLDGNFRGVADAHARPDKLGKPLALGIFC